MALMAWITRSLVFFVVSLLAAILFMLHAEETQVLQSILESQEDEISEEMAFLRYFFDAPTLDGLRCKEPQRPWYMPRIVWMKKMQVCNEQTLGNIQEFVALQRKRVCCLALCIPLCLSVLVLLKWFLGKFCLRSGQASVTAEEDVPEATTDADEIPAASEEEVPAPLVEEEDEMPVASEEEDEMSDAFEEAWDLEEMNERKGRRMRKTQTKRTRSNGKAVR